MAFVLQISARSRIAQNNIEDKINWHNKGSGCKFSQDQKRKRKVSKPTFAKIVNVQGDPKESEWFFKNGLASKWVKPHLQNFLWFLSIIMAIFPENLVTIASSFLLSLALLD